MVRHAHADSAAFGMLQTPGHLACRRQDEREAARRALLQDPELPRVDARVTAHFGEIAADERQVMTIIDPAYVANALRGLPIAELTTERIARIGRIGHHAATTQDL